MYNRQLDVFLKVAESGSFSRAARALFVTPSAVIQQINTLESQRGAICKPSHRRSSSATSRCSARCAVSPAMNSRQFGSARTFCTNAVFFRKSGLIIPPFSPVSW